MDPIVPLLAMAVVVGLSKGGLASAAAVAVPFLSLFMNPVEAAAILLPVFLVTDWAAVALYRRHYSGRNLAILIPAMAVGTILAVVLTPVLPETALLAATGLIGLWYVGRTWLARAVTEPHGARIAPGLFWGVVTGVTSFITHSGSPPAQVYLMPQRLAKLTFAGTIAIAFAAGNLAKLPGYWALGALDGLDLGLTLSLVAAGLVGTALGRWLVALLPAKAYRRVIEGLLVALSLILLGKAAAQAFGFAGGVGG